MGMTITEKILAAHAGKSVVVPGEIISVTVDVALGNDITAPIAIKEFKRAGANKVFDRTRVALVPDHFAPNKDIASAEQCKILRDFAREQDLENYFETGEMGVEHALLPEQGIVGPGDVVIGADSHTCTYGALGAFSTGVGSTDLAAAMITGKTWFKVPETIKFVYTGKLGPFVDGKDLILYTIGKIGVDGALYRAMEFTGPVIDSLPIEDRLTMANMAIEAGGKNGIFIPDAITKEYVEGRFRRKPVYYTSDPDAKYAEIINIDCSSLRPQIAFPHLPSNTRSVDEAGNVPIDQVVIGSCTNGRLEDMRLAAGWLKGRRVAKGIRLIILPGSQRVWRESLEEGLLAIFADAGAVVSAPTCGPCLGGHMGILAAGERCVSTTNRNFVGRMGHVKSEVYLAGVPVAAASAVAGHIAGPDEIGADGEA
jgi:3-isopropylmalate/(R)-2-methylmalate dehydratase large subunit